MTRFKDFNFKLAVVEQLMYTDEALTPAYSLAAVLKEQGLGDDPWGWASDNGLAYKVVPQSREFFERLEISDELLAGVEELCLDGGNQVYQECAPVWDGEDDLFAIASLEDLDLLPNLKRVEFAEALSEELQEVLRARGIEIDD
ncbi:DUF6892 domain-containing protein [Nocardiopsis changdeensis]|uniref:DUF6892 domain-containing protein n=1 Tax=Nocardiopsis changdeensis TaxID=2831969 RepID=A0ABX8BQ74_9ACTN|nr:MULTISPECIES: hypothetical protein [Nocardiopsis]QUX22888.1 hypothetical protein KGD84_00210 [Nocardiopsis changdeensis]QYX38831.1 hypothetical protein K1J57_09660 [Nocardiopsis sp. MT53]